MRRLAFVFCLLAAGEAAWSASDRANLFSFRAPDGWGEVEWISGSSFRWTRVWGRALEKGRPIKAEPVEVSRKDLGDRWEFTSNYLVVEVEKSGLKFRVMSAEGKVLAEMLTVRQEPGAVVLEFGAEKSERYYGLGVRAAAELNLRGQVVRAGKPFLVSSLGYGEYYGAPGNYVFDLAQGQAERRQVRIEGGDRVEYYFHYGPSPKEVLEEQMALGTPGADLKAADFGILEAAAVPAGVGKLAAPGEASWTSLRDSIHSLMHAGLSAVLASALDLGPYLGAEGALLERATQLGGVMPVVWVSRPGGAVREGAAYRRVLEMRKRLTPLLVTYAQEARERGFPMVRPLALQFAADREAWKWTDEFLLGDELLIAPVYTPENRREVYLPRGIWTDLRSNRVYQSRQTVQVEAAPEELPMLAKNGSIVPLAPLGAGEPWALHYFPKLGAEFFVLEEDLGDYTLLHAAPALEVVRLEIESLKDRDYEWVVHHTGPCRKVAQVDGPEYREAGSLKELKPGRWFYDRERNNVHIRARAGANQDHIINVWLEVAWN